jgi:hypothetical protein
MTELFEHKYENPEWKGYTKFLPEVIAVKVGAKPVMRIPVSKDFGYKHFKHLCTKLGLITGLSDYAITEPYTKDDIVTDGSDGDRFMYVAKDGGLIAQAKKTDLHDEEAFGELMGYPKCCTDYYDRILVDKPDQELHRYVQSGKKLSWYNNYLLRFNSHYYLHAYFICSFDCRKSEENAKLVLEGIREFDPLYAEKIEHHLKLPILFDDSRPGGIMHNWDRLKGVVLNGDINGNEVRYGGQFALWQGSHFPDFAKGDTVTLADKEIIVASSGQTVSTLRRPSQAAGFLLQFR